MDLDRAASIGLALGQEFLTWLWFASETRAGLFRTKSGEAFTLNVEQKVSIQGGEGEAKETAVCSGPMAELVEARLGLRTGKKVNKAQVRIEKDEASWQVFLDAATLTMQGLKTPKVDMKVEEGEDPDARVLEKMYLLEKCLEYVDSVFAQFIEVRFGDRWPEEVVSLRRWLY